MPHTGAGTHTHNMQHRQQQQQQVQVQVQGAAVEQVFSSRRDIYWELHPALRFNLWTDPTAAGQPWAMLCKCRRAHNSRTHGGGAVFNLHNANELPHPLAQWMRANYVNTNVNEICAGTRWQSDFKSNVWRARTHTHMFLQPQINNSEN